MKQNKTHKMTKRDLQNDILPIQFAANTTPVLEKAQHLSFNCGNKQPCAHKHARSLGQS